ncbi:carbohydrate binding domain-containing protein [Bacteroidota bacterium]
MKQFILIFVISISFAFSALSQDRSEWFEFYLPWDDSTESVTNMSGYLDAPAGKHGFLQVTPEGHFRFENLEKDIRFTGVVNVAIANYPSKAYAPIIAARMAKYGINLVRIHLVDVENQYGLFENSADNTIQLSEIRLDNMDYFIHCLKEQGIYFNFCIHSGRIYKDGDGIMSPVLNNQSKYVTLFDDRIIELQKLFAEQTMGHVNPYTGLRYADDPALANVELTNENQLYNGWFGWQSDYLFGENPDGIGPYYSAVLDTLYNGWLQEHYPDDDSLRSAWSGQSSDALELVTNNSFEEDLSGWSTYIRTEDGAVASIEIDDTAAVDGAKSVRFSVASSGTESWHVQMKTNNYPVEQYSSYKINFYARSDSEESFRIQIMENDTWKWIGAHDIEATADWKLHEYHFTSPFSSSKLIIQFDFGHVTGNYWIDSVSVIKSGGSGLEEGESMLEGNVERVRYAQIGKYSKARVGDDARFYFDLEGDFIATMMDYLKDELGIKVPITFTNNYYGLASIYSQSRADYMDMHAYWDHPNYPNGWSNTNFTIHNRPMVKDPEGSTLNRFSLSRVEGKPLVLSEYNHPYPQIYQCEAPSLLYAYGGYFDFDGIEWHAYYDYMNKYTQRYQDMFFDIAMHPVMMTQHMLSIPYRLGYIKPAENIVKAHYNEQQVFNNTKLYQNEDVLNIKDVNYGTSFLKDRFIHASFSADSNYLDGSFSMPEGVIHSDENQLNWDGDAGVFTVNNPYWQGATGFLGGQSITLNDITISNVSTTNGLDFAYVHLLALDSLPIIESKKMVLLTGARLENEGFLWNSTQTSPAAVGGTRALCEPVSGQIDFNFSARDSFYMFRLDERGLRSDIVFESDTTGEKSIEFNARTLWYEIFNDTALVKKIYSDTTVIDTTVTDTTVTDTTGILYNRLQLRSYPNPCYDVLNIDLSALNGDDTTLVFFNAQGQQVLSRAVQSVMNRVVRLDVSTLPEGLYYYGVRNETGYSSMNKLIKLENP